jgi:hypothetical protein
MSKESQNRITAEFEQSAEEGYSARIRVHLDGEMSQKLRVIAEKSGLDYMRQNVEAMIEQQIVRQWQAVMDLEARKQIDPATGWSMDDLELFSFAGIEAGKKPSDPTEAEKARDRAYRAIPKKLRAQGRTRLGHGTMSNNSAGGGQPIHHEPEQN